MIIDEEVYLAHVGVKGMRWGVRKQRYQALRARKNQSGRLTNRQRAGVAAGAYAIGSAASVVSLFGLKSTTLASVVGLPAMVGGGVYIRKHMLNKHGGKTISQVRAAKSVPSDAEAVRRVEAFLKKHPSGSIG